MFVTTRIRLLFCFFMLLSTSIAGACSAQQPNIILINFDDADSEMFELDYSDQLYPNIMSVAKSGISFNNLHVTTPFCGPSRACLYRAQYAHNSGIRINDPSARTSNNFDGGMEFYDLQGYFFNDLGTWMQNAGYRTMMVGKFLHHGFKTTIPPGWDDFHSYLGARYWRTWRYTNEDAPEGRFEQLPAGLYRTTEETRDVVRTLENHAANGGDRPFFLNINTFGPHEGAPGTDMVDTTKLDWWPEMKQPYSSAFNEADISDKRGFFRDLPELFPASFRYAENLHRDRALAMRSCDDMVGVVRHTLARLNMDDNTYIFITSDNGFLNGHHRAFGKGTPVNRATRVPFFIMGPGVPAGRTANHLMAHIDLGPTILGLAGRVPPSFVDGRSFTHLLTPTGIDDHAGFRSEVLIENVAQYNVSGRTAESASNALRTVDSIYTEWANGDKDFYNLVEDPEQLNNRYDDLHPIIQNFYASWLRTLKNPDQKSNARFSVPFGLGNQIPAGQGLRGLAEDPQGVEHVRLAIYDLQAKRYWNGSQWQPSFALVRGELENPGGQISFWNYREMPVGDNVVTGQMAAWVWSYDKNFVHAPPTVAIFSN